MRSWCFWKRVVQHLARLRPGDMKRWCSIFGASPVLTEWATSPDGGVSVTFSSPLANPVYLHTPEWKLFSVTILCYLFYCSTAHSSFGSCLHLGHLPTLIKSLRISVYNKVELHLSGLIGKASHTNMQKIRRIRFFFENMLHWQFCIDYLQYVPASKPFDLAWFDFLETITLYCTVLDPITGNFKAS
jgi:hypothetical protein